MNAPALNERLPWPGPAERTAAVEVRSHTALADCERLVPEWRVLWWQDERATPFQSPGWLLHCWEAQGTEQLWILSAHVEDRLVGLLPLGIHFNLGTGERRVHLLGTGPSDYLDVLVAPAWADAVVPALVDRLQRETARWDLCDFQELRADSPLVGVELPAGWPQRLDLQSRCPVLELPPEAPDVSAVVPRRFWRQLGHCRRRLAALGSVRLERADVQSFPELFEAFMHLHGARWSRFGRFGVAADLAPLLREAGIEFLAQGQLRLYALRLGNRIIASLLAFEHHRRFHYYLGGFDPEFASWSPGSLLIGEVVQDAICSGARAFDFLRGDEPYKYRWGARDRSTHRRQFRHHPV